MKTDAYMIRKTNKHLAVAIRIIVYITLAAVAFTMVFPYFWMVMASFKSIPEANSVIPTLFPEKFLFGNYRSIWSEVKLLRAIFNTMVVEVSVIVAGTFVSVMAAFSFAKLKLRYKTTLLLVLMSGMMIPYAALLLPQYRAFSALGMTDTLLPLILPGFFGNVSMIFFFVQYMKRIPSAIFEAAKIDGASYFKMMLTVMVPLILPALAVQIVFWFLGIWNDFFAPSIYLTKKEIMTLQPILASLNSQYASGLNLPKIMTGAVLSSIPTLAVYLCVQKYLLESLTVGAVKG